MSILKILSYPDPKLKRHGKKVTEINSRIKQIIADMFETHYNTKNCAALAATQLDLPDPPHITVIDFSENKKSPLCLINGIITERLGFQKNTEGCMSICPDNIHAHVIRSESITVEYMDQDGNNQKLTATGFMAKCIQHELDHLNGIVYLDHLSRIKRTLIENKISRII